MNAKMKSQPGVGKRLENNIQRIAAEAYTMSDAEIDAELELLLAKHEQKHGADTLLALAVEATIKAETEMELYIQESFQGQFIDPMRFPGV